MIHDILLSLLNPHSETLPVDEFLNSDALSVFIHPCEKKILEEIVKIIYQHREIAKFTLECSSNQKSTQTNLDDDSHQKGLYVQAFAIGIDTVLEKYLEEIANLEKHYLQNPTHSLLFIFYKINVFQPLFSFLQKLLRGIGTQKLHGCTILQYIHQNMLHGNEQINKAMQIIQSSVNIVFLKQVTHWILYGKIVDTYGEFFIECSESRNNTLGSEKCISIGSGKQVATTISDTTSTYAEIWKYEICYDFLPHHLTLNWAEKVLFIGQTVLMFKVDAKNKSNKGTHEWNESETNNSNDSLWNNNEHVFFKKIQDLQSDKCFNISRYERVIDEIKEYVTERLSKIAVVQADLVKQLKLIKDFYLLGRGELFLEFIKNTHTIDKSSISENTVRDLIKAFDSAAHSVNVVEDLEQFTFTIPKERIDTYDSHNFGYIKYLTMHYKINWPLHLLFSPKVMDQYNELFRFLFLIKRIQYDLHMVWFHHRHDKQSNNVNMLQLRNQLMCFIDNLQYYIQADVLESQYSILMNTVHNSNDFEHIQRSHSIFQANILSLCFLLGNEEFSASTSTIQPKENPVLEILNKIFHLCEEFCGLATSENQKIESKINDLNKLESELLQLIEKLLNLLVGLKSASNSTSLSQLLLRLDFNYWFSSRSQEKVE